MFGGELEPAPFVRTIAFMPRMWTGRPSICAGRLREPGEVYDDLPDEYGCDVTDAPAPGDAEPPPTPDADGAQRSKRTRSAAGEE